MSWCNLLQLICDVSTFQTWLYEAAHLGVTKYLIYKYSCITYATLLLQMNK